MLLNYSSSNIHSV